MEGGQPVECSQAWANAAQVVSSKGAMHQRCPIAAAQLSCACSPGGHEAERAADRHTQHIGGEQEHDPRLGRHVVRPIGNLLASPAVAHVLRR